MTTIEYAPALDPLLEISVPEDWLVGVVPEPGQRLTDADRQEERLLGQLLLGSEQPIATRLGFVYYGGLSSDQETSTPDNQISVRYDSETEQYELSSMKAKTTVRTVDAATDWINDQFHTVETVVDTYLVVSEIGADIHGLGRTGLRGLVNTFETIAAIRDADVETLADVPYVSEENATAVQTALADVEASDGGNLTARERELQSVDSPLILDLQEGPVAGKLVPSGASEPKYRTDGFEWLGTDR
ncbi:helix-hairpin-helix domain-containing protein [Halovenus salina]|uniref:Helix-hairpin-helix domain-containing protein n=1 Tax=Halovenus salina TaxID=1510225 RepID=A0ABD5W6B4_9EURY|nr:helix-hairpin-helix domain-containing protein [Halovenus salina]